MVINAREQEIFTASLNLDGPRHAPMACIYNLVMKPRSYNVVRDAVQTVSGVAWLLCACDAHNDVSDICVIIYDKVTNG